MSIQQLKSAAAELSDVERRELINYLVALGRQKSPEYWERSEAKIADHDPAHWVSEDELDRVLHLDGPEA